MPTQSHVLHLHPLDNVFVALVDLPEGHRLAQENIICRQAVPAGHKVASAPIPAGASITKYGQIIGMANCDIRAGDHVHTHNLGMGSFERDYAVGQDVRPPLDPADPPEFFQGIVRPDGRVATRNYIGVISTVNCSSSVVRLIADEFRSEALAEYPGVDGIVPICHGLGCGMAGSGTGFEYLRDSLAGYSRHPNFAGVLFIGLGCEVMQVDAVVDRKERRANLMVQTMTIQEKGGTRRTIQEAVARVREMLPVAAGARRGPVPAGRLIVGLECGGSDALSGITAKGLVFMDTPGYDPVSLNGIVAGGANLICFTTGRGPFTAAGRCLRSNLPPTRLCTHAWPRTWTSTAARLQTGKPRSQSLEALFFGACRRLPPAAGLKANCPASATTSSFPGKSVP